MIRIYTGAAIAASIVLSSAAATHAASYQIVDLGTLGGATSTGLDVNNARVVSGTSLVGADAGSTGSLLRAFTSAAGGPPLMTLGALAPTATETSPYNRYSRAYAVNDSGVAVGEFNNNSSRAFVYTPGTGMVGLTRLSGGADNGVAQDINNAGVIVGVSSNGTVSRATRWTYTGGTYVPSDLGSADGLTATAARANAVNRDGVAAGLSRVTGVSSSQATLFAGSGTATSLGSLGNGSLFSAANGLNDNNAVVGYSYTGQTVGQLIGTSSTTDVQRAFVAQGGTITELAPVNLYSPANTGSTTNYHSVATDINNAGLVVGNSQRVQGSAAVATLWLSGVAIDLNALVPAGSGWNFLSAEGINDAGDITGYGTIGGVQHAFLLTVPEPASLAASLLIGAPMMRRSRRLVVEAKS